MKDLPYSESFSLKTPEYVRLFGDLGVLKQELRDLGEDYQAVMDREARIHDVCKQHRLSVAVLAASMPTKKRTLLDSQHRQIMAASEVFIVNGEPVVETDKQQHAALVYRLVGRAWLTNYHYMLDRIDKQIGRAKGLRGFTSQPVAALEA